MFKRNEIVQIDMPAYKAEYLQSPSHVWLFDETDDYFVEQDQTEPSIVALHGVRQSVGCFGVPSKFVKRAPVQFDWWTVENYRGEIFDRDPNLETQETTDVSK